MKISLLGKYWKDKSGYKYLRKTDDYYENDCGPKQLISDDQKTMDNMDTEQIGDKELVATSPNQRNWRGIGIALLVILAVLSLIVTAVVLLTPPNEGQSLTGERLSLADTLLGSFTFKTFNGTWISDYEFVYRNGEGALYIYNADALNSTLLAHNTTFRQLNAHRWWLSADRQYLLLAFDLVKLYRYSFLARYTIFDIKNERFTPLSPVESQHMPLQYAAWGPTGNSLVFVYRNDIFYKSNALVEEPWKLTTTGQDITVFNGIPDWVYEEEISHTNKAIWFSQDGKMLCYVTFNDSLVDLMHFEWYGEPSSRLSVYPQVASIRYPKAGQTNPSIVLWVTDLRDKRAIPRDLKPPTAVRDQDHYYYDVTWLDSSTVSVLWMNRAQNVSAITLCKAPIWFCNESSVESTGKKGWVDAGEAPVFSTDGTKYFYRSLAMDGSGYYKQIAMKNLENNKRTLLTHGKFEVTEINGYNSQLKTVYYTAAPSDFPGQRHLFSVSDSSVDGHKLGKCLTCDLDPECLYNKATFSLNSAKYYVLECMGPGVPKVLLFRTVTNELMDTLESNNETRVRIAGYAMPIIKKFIVPIANGRYEAQVKLLLPPSFRDTDITKYPMVVNVYGGPGSQQVDEQFKINWGTYLAGSRQVIYALIDGRGSGFQGEDHMWTLYKKLGTAEVEDQIAVVKWLRENLYYVDGNKVAIWGWSYGGFVAASALAVDNEGIFKCAMAVAPVTSWIYYDSIYTERYMGSPSAQDNWMGYEKSDLMKKVEHFRNKKFFLIHGTADDNVHFQQSMMLSKALTHAGVQFRTQVYPDENHSLYGVKPHLYEALIQFLSESFSEEGMESGLLTNYDRPPPKETVLRD